MAVTFCSECGQALPVPEPGIGHIYEISEDNLFRYALGRERNGKLICIGINPSTATPDNYDQTVTQVKSIAEYNNYASWLMLNVYPQRATDPKKLARSLNEEAHQKNLDVIDRLVENNSTIWAAWGDSIEKRAYLKQCARDIYECLKKKQGIKWKMLKQGPLKDGHPPHPSRKPVQPFVSFDAETYFRKHGLGGA
jgi:hypothetical protein